MPARRRAVISRKPQPGAAGPRSAGRLQGAIDAAARREIEAALKETTGNLTHAARALGVSRMGLWKRLTALGIDPDRYRS